MRAVVWRRTELDLDRRRSDLDRRRIAGGSSPILSTSCGDTDVNDNTEKPPGSATSMGNMLNTSNTTDARKLQEGENYTGKLPGNTAGTEKERDQERRSAQMTYQRLEKVQISETAQCHQERREGSRKSQSQEQGLEQGRKGDTVRGRGEERGELQCISCTVHLDKSRNAVIVLSGPRPQASSEEVLRRPQSGERTASSAAGSGAATGAAGAGELELERLEADSG